MEKPEVWYKIRIEQDEQKQSRTVIEMREFLDNIRIDKITEILNGVYNNGDILEDPSIHILT